MIRSTLVLAALVACGPATAKDQLHHLKLHEPKPGQTVVVQAVSDSPNGTITVTRGSTTQKGSMSAKRSRTFERSLEGSGPRASLRYKVLMDQRVSTMNLGGSPETDTVTGGLVGQAVYGIRDRLGRWRLFLEQATANNRQAIDLAELEAYENRRWFPPTPVAVGQSWAIDPGFIRHLTERDLGGSVTKATMTFKSVDMIDNEQTAVLSFVISTAGTAQNNSGTTAGAAASLQGTVHVALDTMLDKKTIMTGTLTTRASQAGQSTEVSLPVNYVVTKKVR